MENVVDIRSPRTIGLDQFKLLPITHNALRKAGILNLGQLSEMTKAQLLALPNVGWKSISELRLILAFADMSLRDDVAFVTSVRKSLGRHTTNASTPEQERDRALDALERTASALERIAVGWKL